MQTIREPARDVPIIADVDICVVGGSATGVFAAVRAAALGARVAIVERLNCFGGTATAGLVNVWHSLYDTTFSHQIIAGLTHQVIEQLQKRDAVIQIENSFNACRLNTEELKIELDALVLQHEIETFLHTLYAGPYIVNDRLAGIFVQSKSGRGVIRAAYFVDASGDGDLCRDLGFAHYTGEHLQPPTMCAKIQGLAQLPRRAFLEALQKHGADYGLPEDWGWSGPIPNTDDVLMHAETHVFGIDGSQAEQLTRAEIEGRRQVRAMMDLVREQISDPPRLALLALASAIGLRETRRFNALYKLTESDLLSGHRFDDAIANGTYRIDIHHSDGAGITFRYLDGTEIVWRNRQDKEVGRWRDPIAKDPTFYQIPFRSLLPQGSHNVIMAGRILDADRASFGAARVMVNMNQTGEAAGTAAYLALSADAAIADVDPAKLRAVLAAGGSIIL